MPSRQQLERALVRVGKAAPPGLRGRLGRATRALRGGWRGTLVTVLVAVSDEETWRVQPCLESLRGQTHRNIDIRVVPWGRAARATEVARQQAGEDWRIRIDPSAADRAAAWNGGAARAKAGFVMFVQGGDDLPPTSVERLLACLEESGSDMAVGRIEPPLVLHAAAEPPHEAAHQTEVRRTTLAGSPVAITDLSVGNRLFRTEFWRRAGLAFDAGDRLGTELALASYTRATTFDLLTDPAYIPTNRREGFSVGAVRDELSELDTWLQEHDVTRESVAALGNPEVTDWWLWGVLDTAIQPFLGDVERATPEQWKRLGDHVNRLVEAGGDSAWRGLRADSRVKLWLVRHDRRSELEDYVAARVFLRDMRPTVVRDGRVFAVLPFFEDPAVGIPDDEYEMGEVETALWASLQGVGWPGPDRLQLDAFVRIKHIDLDEDPVVRAWLAPRGGGERIPLEVVQRVDPFANIVEMSRFQDYSRGAVSITVDTTELARRAVDAGRRIAWSLELEIVAAGLTRSGRLALLDERGSAGMSDLPHLGARTLDGARVGVRGRNAPRFVVFAEPSSGPELVDAQVTGSTVRALVRPGPEGVTGARLVSDGAGTERAKVRPVDDLVEVVAELPRLRPPDQPRRFALRAVTSKGRAVPVAWPAAAGQWLGSGTGELAASRSGSGHVDVVDATATLVAEEIRIEGDRVELDGRWLGVPPDRFAVRLEGPGVSIDGEAEDTPTGVVVRFSTLWDEWGLGEAAIPVGRFLFVLEHGAAGHPGRVLLGERELDRIFDFRVSDQFRWRVVRDGDEGREAGIVTMPALADDERGPYWQTRLQEWFATSDLPIEQDLVYLQSYAGGSATDSQLAVFEELRRSRPDLRVAWGVADRRSLVPEGATPVLLNSREWYGVLATARYLCMNIDPERWWFRRPGQDLLQTFHGYPAKSMGIRMWEAKGYTPRRVQQELDRTSREWSLILTPAPEMDELYRREYRYDGPIHSAGYPRDDLLVSPEAEQVREETRRRLGIRPDQRAVLYAPTWRDDLATNWRRAEMVAHLDLEAASRQLGPEYVLLMRGHRFHAETARTHEGSARLLDVTSYPEINHLILAADVAVLDYSSLRFDFALTGRPMVFLVPDLATYTGGVRGFLYPFEDSAPGPLLDTADEVVARLRDLDGLSRDYGDAIRQFNETYNYLQDGRSAERVVRAFFG